MKTERLIDRILEMFTAFILGIVLGFVISNADNMADARMEQCEKLFISHSYEPSLKG